MRSTILILAAAVIAPGDGAPKPPYPPSQVIRGIRMD